MSPSDQSDNPTRECVWCNESVPVLADGSLRAHRWVVEWDRERDRPIKRRCVGSRTSIADALEAMQG